MKQLLLGFIFFSALLGVMAFNIYIIPIFVFSIFSGVACWMMGSIIEDVYYNYKHKEKIGRN